MTRYSGRADAISAPAQGGFAITPSHVADLAAETRGLWVGASAICRWCSPRATRWFSPAPGSVLPLRVRRVKAAGTTATQLVGLY